MILVEAHLGFIDPGKSAFELLDRRPRDKFALILFLKTVRQAQTFW